MFFADPGFACYAIHKESIEEFIDLLAKEGLSLLQLPS